MMPHFKRTDLLIQPAIDQIRPQENRFFKDLELTSEKNSDLLIPLQNMVKPEMNQYVQNDWSAPMKTTLALNPDTTHSIFLKLISQISRAEYLFLENALLEMITHVHQLRTEMENLCRINGPRIKDLKRELKLLKESLFKMIDINSNGISIEEVKISDRILAIKYELNRLQHNRKYNVLSDTIAHARVLPTDRLNHSELSNLIKLEILQVVRFPLNLENVVLMSDKNDHSPFNSGSVNDKIQYGFSEAGLKFIEACTGKTL
jgi:hypothetical protein